MTSPAPHPDPLWAADLAPLSQQHRVARMWLGCELVAAVAFPTHLCSLSVGPRTGGGGGSPRSHRLALCLASCHGPRA